MQLSLITYAPAGLTPEIGPHSLIPRLEWQVLFEGAEHEEISGCGRGFRGSVSGLGGVGTDLVGDRPGDESTRSSDCGCGRGAGAAADGADAGDEDAPRNGGSNNADWRRRH